MPNRTRHYFFFLMKWYLLILLLSPFFESAFGLGEIFETYHSPQGLAMGDAMTADATGYAAAYYNPAGVATLLRRRWEVNLLDLEGSMGFNGMGTALKAQTLGTYRIMGALKSRAGDYQYFNFASVPSVTIRGFSFSLLGAYQFAALSDGTNVDLNTRQDLGATVAYARYFAGNVIKLGVAGKYLIRNELKGVYTHALLAQQTDTTYPALFKEGAGIGGDIGMILTLPSKWLPTLGLVWKDVFGTYFSSSRVINKRATGSPEKIPQSFNAAISIHPILSPRLKSTFAVEYKHIELTTLPFRKHFHLGIQLEDIRQLYFWAGLNQLYITAGVGYRVKGGNLEIGTYGEDVGAGNASKEDRRFVFRYTISF